uniref:Uncharacterized protein n=1 Tax=Amphimedon queenslandica TaxID=400682 RepID=A0A1X7VI98_AMPQE
MAVQGDMTRSEFSCDVIGEIDTERRRMPTREDVRILLDKYQGNLFYFNFCFNAPPPAALPEPAAPSDANANGTQRPKKPSPKSKKIINFLWEKYRLYKLKSTRGQPHTLSRSTYLGLLRDGDLNRKKRKINDLIDEAKREILDKGEELNVAKVHVVPSHAIIYDNEEEEEENSILEEEGEHQGEEEEEHQEEVEEEEGGEGEQAEDEEEGNEEQHEEEEGEEQEEEEEERSASVIIISSGEEEEMEEEEEREEEEDDDVICISSDDERDKDGQAKKFTVTSNEVKEERESDSWIDKALLESLEALQTELLS